MITAQAIRAYPSPEGAEVATPLQGVTYTEVGGVLTIDVPNPCALGAVKAIRVTVGRGPRQLHLLVASGEGRE